MRLRKGTVVVGVRVVAADSEGITFEAHFGHQGKDLLVDVFDKRSGVDVVTFITRIRSAAIVLNICSIMFLLVI